MAKQILFCNVRICPADMKKGTVLDKIQYGYIVRDPENNMQKRERNVVLENADLNQSVKQITDNIIGIIKTKENIQ